MESEGRAQIIVDGRAGTTEANEEARFAEFRKKMKRAEVLSGSMVRLVKDLRFSGRVSVVIKNGRVMKSGYEEGYAVISDL